MRSSLLFLFILSCFSYLKQVKMIYVIATSKQHLMWEFKIWLIVFRLNTADRSTCRNHLCFRGDSCIDLWDVLLWVPAAVSWWGKALEWLSLPRITCFRLCTQSPQTLLNGTCLHNQSIRFQSIGLVSTWKGKVVPHSMHFLPHEHTPTRSWHAIAQVELH